MPDANLPNDRQPDVSPTGDPNLAALLVRCRRIRVELDRLDDRIDLLSRGDRAELCAETAQIRSKLDDVEALIEAKAARR